VSQSVAIEASSPFTPVTLVSLLQLNSQAKLQVMSYRFKQGFLSKYYNTSSVKNAEVTTCQ